MQAAARWFAGREPARTAGPSGQLPEDLDLDALVETLLSDSAAHQG